VVATSKPVVVSDRTVRIVRWSLLAFAAVVLLLVFAVPRTPPPPPSLAQPEQGFVDLAGIVSPAFAREWAGALLNDDRAQIVVYVDRNLPEGNFAAWATQTATDWKIGTARNDTGIVISVFTEPRLARIEVGYGFEGVISDARARQLLEAHLEPAVAQGQYERGFDALIFAIRKEIGGDDAESIHRRAAEARKAQRPWYAELGPAFARSPRLVSATLQNFREGGAGERIAILVFVGVGLTIVLAGLGAAVNTAWILATFPAKVREKKAGGERLAVPAVLFQVVIGCFGFFACLALTSLVLLAAEGMLTRKGSFSGAGAAIVWPATR
jgi:uncharacterized membrane protein YgcG